MAVCCKKAPRARATTQYQFPPHSPPGPVLRQPGSLADSRPDDLSDIHYTLQPTRSDKKCTVAGVLAPQGAAVSPQLEAEPAGLLLAVRLDLVSLEERSERRDVLSVRRRHLVRVRVLG